jgi:exopolyphosphatase/guanosine-5'-triphosphate,3'-diphosphate pyrophosphatase
MKLITPENREHVRRASLLLRLARALNLGRTGAVRKARIQVRNAKVGITILAKAKASVDLELWAVEKEAPYFGEVFGRELSVAAT